MKRPLDRVDYHHQPHLDPREDLSQEQLILIGSITIAYNYLEYLFRGLMNVTVPIRPNLYSAVATRINGFDGILEIIKRAIALDDRIDDTARAEMFDTLATAQRCKSLRDVLIHAMVHPPSGYGWRVGRRGKLEEVLLSETALGGLLSLITHTSQEMVCLILLCANFKDLEPTRFTAEEIRQLERPFPERFARYRQCQTSRKSLPPLPTFPDESPAPKERESDPYPEC